MSNVLYWPYDEVTLTGDEASGQAVVKTPWLEARVAVPEPARADLAALLRKFAEQTLAPADMPLVHGFFQKLSHYPFCYIVPTKKSGALDQPVLDGPALPDESIAAFLAAAIGPDAEDVALPRTVWDWDVAGATAFAASAGGMVHPESLFTVARRFHLIDVVSLNKGKESFSFIDGLEGDAFARAAGLMVRQNHYVTQQCRTSLLPAVEKAGRARAAVERFIQEENGHDKILNVAMKSFAADPDSLPVTAQTKALMTLLRFAAARNFLGFAMVVDGFERSSYEDTDPLAKLLMKGGFDKAARQINRHMDINDAGGHENVALGFLATMGPVPMDYALEALRIAEAVTLVMNAVPQSAIELFAAQ